MPTEKWNSRLRKMGRVLLYVLAVLYLLGLYDNVSTMESSLSSMDLDVSSIESDVGSIQSDVSSIEGEVSSIESNQSTFHLRSSLRPAFSQSARVRLLSLKDLTRHYSQIDEGKTPTGLPELTPRRAECGLFMPERGERHDLARLVRADQFLSCERDGLPKALAPPWKNTEEGEKKLSDACEYFGEKAGKEYPQVGRASLTLATDRCRINVMQIILTKMLGGL